MRYRLSDIADIERARKGKDYPAGATLVQLSASNGQTHYHEGGEVESKYAVVMPIADCPLLPRFLYVYLWSTIQSYLRKIKSDINIQIRDIERYPIEFPIRDDMRIYL